MNNLSYWEKDTIAKKYEFIIIGAGIVGLSTALAIKARQPKARVVVIERGVLPSGASTKNAGFSCFGSLSEILDDQQNMADSEILELIVSRYKGLELLRKTVGDKNLDYQPIGGYELFSKNDHLLFDQCCEQLDQWNKLLKESLGHSNVFSVNKDEIHSLGLENVQSLIFNRLEGAIHPGKMMETLLDKCQKNGVHFLWGQTVQQIESNTVHLMEFSLNANQIVLCTNGFAKQFIKNEDINTVRNQVFVSRKIKDLALKGTFHYDKGYIYFRNIGDRILVGGARNVFSTAESVDTFGNSENLENYLLRFIRSIVKTNEPIVFEHKWSGILGVGQTKSPIIKRVNPNLVIAVRLGGMGVALGSFVGQKAAETVLGLSLSMKS